MGHKKSAGKKPPSPPAHILEVPYDGDREEDFYPTLGPLVCEWMEDNLCFGPGDLRGEPLELDLEQQRLIWRCYEIMPQGHREDGRRRFKRCAFSLAKGLRKTEIAALIAAAELAPDAPVRFDGWDGKGNPKGRPVTDPMVILVAYTEEQSDELAYGALRVILQESPICSSFDIGLERIMRIGGDGKALSLAGSPNARDGARTTFSVFDETHWHTLPKLRQAHQVMLNNLGKRKLADPWALEVTTAYEPGANSIAESTHEYARELATGRLRQAKDTRLFFFHRQASEAHDIKTEKGAREAVIEASGVAAAWRDIDSIVEIWRDPTTDRNFWERVWLNRPTRSTRKAFDMKLFRALQKDTKIADGTMITVGFDGAQFHDATAVVATDIRTGHQWLAGCWEQPAGAEAKDWKVPDDEVDECVRDLFNRFNVWRMYADPPYWQSWISAWRGRYGEERVIEWWTNRRRSMAAALDQFQEAITDGLLSHAGDDPLVRHIGNAHKYELPQRDEQAAPVWLIRKEKSDSPFKIDAAMAAVLSWEARSDAIASGITGEVETVFTEKNLQYWSEEPTGGNRYIVVSPPHDKRTDPEMTNISVVELRADRTYTVLVLLRGRMNLVERTDLVFAFHRRYQPLKVGYEDRGLEGDRQHVLDTQARENYRFKLWELKSTLSDNERIMRLVPIVEKEQLVLPQNYMHEGLDQVEVFRSQEFQPYPYGAHADMLENLSRLFDLKTAFPAPPVKRGPKVYPSDF